VVEGAILVGGLIALDALAFHVLLDSSYVRWYVANGSLIGLAFALVTFAWGDVNKLTALISARPLEFTAGCLELFVLPGAGLGSTLKTGPSQRPPAVDFRSARIAISSALASAAEGESPGQRSGEPRSRVADYRRRLEELSNEAAAEGPSASQGEVTPPLPATPGLGVVDVWVAILFTWTFVLAYVAWLLVVAPLQFVVNLVAGAPARVALASPYRAWFRVTDRGIHVEADWKSDPLPKGAVEAAFTTKPVAFTAVIAAALLFAVSTVVG
jgi:hypothetical protein